MSRKWGNAIAIILVVLLFALHCAILRKFELCMFRSFCGLPCPGCGLTHAAIALFLHGDTIASLRYHALLLPIAGTLFFSCFPYGFWHFADQVKRCHTWTNTLLCGMMVYYIIRMILFFPSQEYPMLYDTRNYLYIFVHFLQSLCSSIG